jgi:hypothetical protein
MASSSMWLHKGLQAPWPTRLLPGPARPTCPACARAEAGDLACSDKGTIMFTSSWLLPRLQRLLSIQAAWNSYRALLINGAKGQDLSCTPAVPGACASRSATRPPCSDGLSSRPTTSQSASMGAVSKDQKGQPQSRRPTLQKEASDKVSQRGCCRNGRAAISSRSSFSCST